jgi:AcrR family transcriptional regulator
MPLRAFVALSEDRQQEIRDVTMDLYNARPYESVTLKLLLEGLRINPATFYRYFKEKDDLYLHTIESVSDKAFANMEARHEGIEELLFGTTVFNDERMGLSDRELRFVDTLLNAPDPIALRFYTGRYRDRVFNYCKASIRQLRLDGRLRSDVDEDLVSFMYASSMFNLMLFYREYGIADIGLQAKLSRYFLMDFFRYGLVKDTDENA